MQISTKKVREDVDNFIKDTQDKYSLDTIKNMDYEMAIGESGKGSVFGSIFITALWWPRSIKSHIEKFRLEERYVSNVQKVEQRAFRKQVFELINLLKDKVIFYQVIELTARQISENMNNMMIHYNLTELINQAVDKICQIPFEKDFKVTHIFSKCFCQKEKEESKIRLNLQEYSSIIQQVKVQSKNDGTYSLTNMANLVARALNENKLDEWKFKEQTYFDEKFGSGGTSDPFTIKWLQENKHHMFGFPDIVRFSWATIPKCLDGVLVMEVKEDYEASKMLKSHNIISRNQKQMHKDLWDLPIFNKK